MRYRNPILPGFHPDPSVCRVGQDYYLVNSSFEYFPGVPIFHSRDLVNWKPIGYCLARDSQVPLRKASARGGIYAPTIRYHAGRFYMVTTNVTGGGNFFVTATDPAGPWSEPIWIDQPGIDPSLFFDDDGQAYYVSNGSKTRQDKHGAFQARIDLQTGHLSEPCTHLWNGTGGQSAEGPHVFKKDGWYYLVLAEGGTEFGHMVTIARSRSVNGPFTPCPHNPILTHRSLESPIQSTGHSDLFEDHRGHWWIAFLGCRHVGYPKMHHIGRETFLAPVEWDSEGWPVVNGGLPVGLEVDTDCIDADQFPSVGKREDFDSATLSMEWNFRRNPDASKWSLTRSPGSLSLRCAAETLFETDTSPAFVGRRQEHLSCTARVGVRFAPTSPDEEAGITIFQTERYRYDLAITQRNGRRTAIVRRCFGTGTVIAAEHPVDDGLAILQVRAEPEWYHLSIQPPAGPSIELAKVETRHVSTEIAGGFVGVFLAMYATGGGSSSDRWADFDYFDYQV